MTETQKNVKVVVLGDIGRSPRMQYHCMSLAEMGHMVDVIGYGETEPMDSIKLNPQIFYHYLMPVPRLPVKLLNYIFKTAFQALNLVFLLFITKKSDFVLIQNPPAIPTMVLCWFYAKVVGAKLVVDWHNYAHTIMALDAGKNNPLVKITEKIEAFVGSKAEHNFCVTKAMQEDLRIKWNINATTLYDRPPLIFKSITLKQKHQFFQHFGHTYHELFKGVRPKDSAFTEIVNSGVQMKPMRPGLIVSSTSWTVDEDFSILLSSLQEYETHCIEGNPRKLPKLICVITGKGPLKEEYLKAINELDWMHVFVITPWLEMADYPLLLASADLGISLHTSSSGLDLPMKVVDMFGCGLPVCAYNFKCLNELVKNEENGYIFTTPQELSTLILNWFEDFPNNSKQQKIEAKFKTNLRSFQKQRWGDNWKVFAAPIFD